MANKHSQTEIPIAPIVEDTFLYLENQCKLVCLKGQQVWEGVFSAGLTYLCPNLLICVKTVPRPQCAVVFDAFFE